MNLKEGGNKARFTWGIVRVSGSREGRFIDVSKQAQQGNYKLNIQLDATGTVMTLMRDDKPFASLTRCPDLRISDLAGAWKTARPHGIHCTLTLDAHGYGAVEIMLPMSPDGSLHTVSFTSNPQLFTTDENGAYVLEIADPRVEESYRRLYPDWNAETGVLSLRSMDTIYVEMRKQ